MMKKMKKYIIAAIFLLFIINNISCVFDLTKERDQSRQVYLQGNDYFIKGSIKNISYLTSSYFMVTLDIDSLHINKRSDT